MTEFMAKEVAAGINFDPAEAGADDEASLPPSSAGHRISWQVIVKIGVSLMLIGLLSLTVDTGQLIDLLTDIAPLPFLCAVLVFVVQCGIAGLRCRAVVGSSWAVPAREHVRFFWIGQFFNQLLPSTIGGDAIRAWLLARRGPSLPTAIKLILVDRLAGVICLLMVMIVVASLPTTSLMLSNEASRVLGLFAGACLLGLAIILITIQLKPLKEILNSYRLTRPAVALFEELAGLIRSPQRAIPVFFLALAVHGCSIVAFWLSAKAIGEPISLLSAAVIVPPMLLIAMMPISVAGWGVREGVVLFGLGLSGVSAEAAISIAILFGVALLIASLPGSLFWFGQRIGRRSTDH